MRPDGVGMDIRLEIKHTLTIGADDRLARLLEKLTIPAASICEILTRIDEIDQGIVTMSDKLQASIDTLIADNAQLQTDVAEAPASIAALVAAAIAAQANAGVTPAQLQSLVDLHTALGGANTQLKAALAGTPPVIPPSPTPTV